MGKSKLDKSKDKFQVAVDYLTEYSGVKGAIIADNEGIIIARSGPAEFDAETFAAFALAVKASIEEPLKEIARPDVEQLTVKTAQDWITIARLSPIILIVAAERHVDDLLSVRITRSLEMISTHMKAKYPAILSRDKAAAVRSKKKSEGVHV